ncbi:ATP-binding protein [Fluviicola taffensis]|uniref:sensor histidine kinase n=1 Tax=Fluviicola taffensis TaxID=191579 RepID=UPI0031378462
MNDIILSIVAATLLILLLIAGIAITFFISSRQRMRQEQILIETKLAFERELRQVETEVSEHVMGQFANELHDNIGQKLTAIHFEIESLKLDRPHNKDEYKPLEIYLDEATQQLKLLSKTLNNEFVAYSGLHSSIQVEVNRMNHRGRDSFIVHLDADSTISVLKKEEELMVFRIFQEILQNVMKHSAAKNVFIRLRSNSEGFELRVKDDGKGFDYVEVFKQNKASGLRNILKRASLAQLECKIQTKVGEGTSYILKKSPN